MRTYKIAAMGGDGIGPEVVEAGAQVLKVCAERDGGFSLDFHDFDWGSDYYRKPCLTNRYAPSHGGESGELVVRFGKSPH